MSNAQPRNGERADEDRATAPLASSVAEIGTRNTLEEVLSEVLATIKNQNHTNTSLFATLLDRSREQDRLLESLAASIKALQATSLQDTPTFGRADATARELALSKQTAIENRHHLLPIGKEVRQMNAQRIQQLYEDFLHMLKTLIGPYNDKQIRLGKISNAQLQQAYPLFEKFEIVNTKGFTRDQALLDNWPSSNLENFTIQDLAGFFTGHMHGNSLLHLITYTADGVEKSELSSENRIDSAPGIIIDLEQDLERNDVMIFRYLLLVLSQFVPPQQNAAPKSLRSERQDYKDCIAAVYGFLSDFIWREGSMGAFCQRPRIASAGHGFDVNLTITGLSLMHGFPRGQQRRGLFIDRARGGLPMASSAINIMEHRTSLCIKVFPDRSQFLYSVIILRDGHSRADEKRWKANTAGRATNIFKPFYLFFKVVEGELVIHQERWNELLGKLDGEVNTKLEQVSDIGTLKRYLFDDFQLSMSTKYFALLQHLRIYEDWVRATQEGLLLWCSGYQRWFKDQNIVATLNQEIYHSQRDVQEDLDQIFADWEGLVKQSHRNLEQLILRIRNKREEVITLRDGLFNATSVREAISSSRLNRYVLVFTVVTVIYLPLSFITGFFGMNNLNTMDRRLTSSSRPFALMFGLLCSGTYLLTAGGLWWYNHVEKRKKEQEVKKKKTGWETQTEEEAEARREWEKKLGRQQRDVRARRPVHDTHV